ncbi:hypothetical protein EJ05DRAFT_500888 [Pseudovirgaria hyperparasitica]|uniref:Uncharacterized protein n=1 Tax=Pseudovirgaria hyperparasitica TaxID=470096 RepID=A0A6A6W599_9PEZI|nr:uncharacterized protein EJ05DRAFT_500888 [Pseudovirgaria hyperparasitica]KAF2757349.1 hypothetical protein EJ05DRAFT_500888 [Pseudovirgaria hyperparasitica]
MAIGPWGAMAIALAGSALLSAVGYGIWRTMHRGEEDQANWWQRFSTEQDNYMRQVRERNLVEMDYRFVLLVEGWEQSTTESLLLRILTGNLKQTSMPDLSDGPSLSLASSFFRINHYLVLEGTYCAADCAIHSLLVSVLKSAIMGPRKPASPLRIMECAEPDSTDPTNIATTASADMVPPPPPLPSKATLPLPVAGTSNPPSRQSMSRTRSYGRISAASMDAPSSSSAEEIPSDMPELERCPNTSGEFSVDWGRLLGSDSPPPINNSYLEPMFCYKINRPPHLGMFTRDIDEDRHLSNLFHPRSLTDGKVHQHMQSSNDYFATDWWQGRCLRCARKLCTPQHHWTNCPFTCIWCEDKHGILRCDSEPTVKEIYNHFDGPEEVASPPKPPSIPISPRVAELSGRDPKVPLPPREDPRTPTRQRELIRSNSMSPVHLENIEQTRRHHPVSLESNNNWSASVSSELRTIKSCTRATTEKVCSLARRVENIERMVHDIHAGVQDHRVQNLADHNRAVSDVTSGTEESSQASGEGSSGVSHRSEHNNSVKAKFLRQQECREIMRALTALDDAQSSFRHIFRGRLENAEEEGAPMSCSQAQSAVETSTTVYSSRSGYQDVSGSFLSTSAMSDSTISPSDHQNMPEIHGPVSPDSTVSGSEDECNSSPDLPSRRRVVIDTVALDHVLIGRELHYYNVSPPVSSDRLQDFPFGDGAYLVPEPLTEPVEDCFIPSSPGHEVGVFNHGMFLCSDQYSNDLLYTDGWEVD